MTRGLPFRISVGLEGEEANGPSGRALVAGDGSMVAFTSSADNLVDGDDNAGEGEL